MGGLVSVLYYMLVPSAIMFTILNLTTVLGFEDLDDGDLDLDGDLNVFTFRNLLGFFTFFPLSTIIMIDEGVSDLPAILIGCVIGVVFVFLLLLMMKQFDKLRSDNTFKISNTVGYSGDVYLTIPKGGVGKINIVVNDTFRVLDAQSKDGDEIKTGELVVVDSIVNGKVLVNKVKLNK